MTQPIRFPSFIENNPQVCYPALSGLNWLLAIFLQRLGRFLRNSFYLPLYAKQISPMEVSAQKIAKEACEKLPEEDRRCFEVKIKDGDTTRTFPLRVFERPLGDKTVRIVVFSLNDNREETNGSERKWNPATIQELSRAPLDVLQAIQQEDGVHVDSLMTVSLGNVMWEGAQEEDKLFIPPTIIVNRGFTSVKKIASQLYPFPLNYLLYALARLTGWNADPEQKLPVFCKDKKVIILETPYDYYFSGKGAFAPDFHVRLWQHAASVFRGSFCPFPFHPRAHHAVSLKELAWNCEAKVALDTLDFTSKSGSVAATLANKVFLPEGEDVHTCFIVCGSTTTLDIGAILEAQPLLEAVSVLNTQLQSDNRKDVREVLSA